MQIKNMALCAMFSALLCVCAWISVPIGDISITMQTFGICLCLFLLGGKRGSISILVYLLLGAVGIPVFSGFRGGISVLFGPTGGYIWGFLGCGLLYWLLQGQQTKLLCAILGTCLCYLLGSLWYAHIYLNGEGVSFWAALLKCVVPYILPDAIKIFLAFHLSKKLQPYL